MSTASTPKRFALLGAVASGLLVVASACGGDSGTTATTTAVSEPAATTSSTIATTIPTTAVPTISTAVATSSTAVPTTEVSTTATPVTTVLPVKTTMVNVYWGWTVTDPTAGSPERLGAGAREVAAATPVRTSLEALFDGLVQAEQTLGMTTSIPDGTSVLGIAIDGTTATVDLSSEFASSAGSLDETMRLAQVVFTVTQFDDIDRVKFHLDGVPQESILSHGFEVGDGFTRDSFLNVRPTIMIEQPYPGATFTDPLVVRGESNTFEATVRYAITSGDADGATLLIDGFTTATNGNGTWGSFEVLIDLTDLGDHPAGPGSLLMWEDSPEDGSRRDVVEIPLVLPGG